MAAPDLANWLRSLGLGQYEAAFRENDIDAEVLPVLTEGDLASLGMSLGHRKRLLKAISALQIQATSSAPTTPPTSEPTFEPSHLAERRQLTVMFCDLVGSTELASRLDAEDLREIITRYQACATDTVSRFEGFVAKYMGDGILAYFGYPQAHEDDAEQALRAGLALIDAVGELQASQRLQVRIGIATGLVVVGDLIGTGSAQEQAVVGETANLAARLQGLAEPNTIVIAESTRRQIGALFEIRDLGQQSLKGFAAPQRAWRVLSENRALGRFEGLRSGATSLVGRDEEMELLLRRWAQAKDGRGRLVLISGEPGVGKSRLTEVFAERIASEPHIRLRYFCSPHHQNSALYPIIAQQERAAGFAHHDLPAEKLSKLGTVLAVVAAPIEDVALIAELHSLAATDLAPPLDVSPQRKKEKTFEALLRQVECLSRQQPVLMVFEDIQWIDPSSRELLDLAIERLANWPVLLIATFRPEFQPPWIGYPRMAMLNLARLDRDDTAAMVANIAGDNVLPGEIVEEIAERTDGVPLFVEELTRAVLEVGTQAALPTVPDLALSVPATLHASLMARLDRLGHAAKSVAQTGAVIGREFAHELLATVVELPGPELQEALDRLTNSGLLIARGRPPHASYIFKHALVQDSACGTLLRGRRHELHKRIAAALKECFPETMDSRPELIAHHFTEAGLADRAIRYWLKAGKRALARSAMLEAERLLRKGLTVTAALPDGHSRLEHKLDLQIALGQALFATQGYFSQAAGEAYARARRICDVLGVSDRVLSIIYGQWIHYAVRGDLNQAVQLAAEMREIGERQRDSVARVMGCRISGATHLWLGDFSAARAYLDRGLALYNPADQCSYAEVSAQQTDIAMLGYLSIVLTYCGYLDQAQQRRELALKEARRLAHALNSSFAISHTFQASWIGRLDPKFLLELADELVRISAEHGYGFWREVTLVQRGWCQAVLGQAEAGISLISKGLADARAAGDFLDMPHKLTMAADAYRIIGHRRPGLECLAEAESFAEACQTHETSRLWLRGELLSQVGDQSAAEASLREAIRVAQRQGAKLLELRAATSLARILRDRGKNKDAHTLLAPIYDWFTEGFDAPDLIEAKALLGELAALTRSETLGQEAAVSKTSEE